MPPAAEELEPIRATLRARLPDLVAKYGVAELGLFGSRVRGDHRPDSDLDVLVSFGRPVGLIELCGLGIELEELLGLKVDLVTRGGLKRRIGKRILAEVVPL